MATIIDVLIDHLIPPVVRAADGRGADLPQQVDSLPLALRPFARVGLVIKSVSELPPSPGYEPWLIARGGNRIAARGLAALSVRHGKRLERDARRLPEVVEAIKFLARPRRNRPAIFRKVAILLAAWHETSVFDQIFKDAGLDVFAFVRLVESTSRGEELAYLSLREMAASLEPYLPETRGRKITAAAAAYEFLMEDMTEIVGQSAYTWKDLPDGKTKGDFVDPATLATRREFTDRVFLD